MKIHCIPFDASYHPINYFNADMISFCRKTATLLRKTKIANIVLCSSGSSGLFLCGMLASFLPKAHLLHIRKDSEKHHGYGNTVSSHDYSSIKYSHGTPYHIFVDDFIESGETFQRVKKVASVDGMILLSAGRILSESKKAKDMNKKSIAIQKPISFDGKFGGALHDEDFSLCICGRYCI